LEAKIEQLEKSNIEFKEQISIGIKNENNKENHN